MASTLMVAACGGEGVVSDDTGPAIPFVVVMGDDGVGLVGADWFELAGAEVGPSDWQGPVSVPFRGAQVIVGKDAAAILRPHTAPRVAPCIGCAGVAVSGDRIVSTRAARDPNNGFEIVTFTAELVPAAVAYAQRLAERTTTDYPAENTESPVTLATDADSITVGYLARAGGSRRGPSILAQYGLDGTLRRTAFVDGLVGRSAVSPDGTRLALDVTLSGGACITSSHPTVVDLDGLTVRPVEPAVPTSVRSKDLLSAPWFTVTDLAWSGEQLVVTGEANAPSPDESSGCDADPELFARWVVASTGVVEDVQVQHRAARIVGASCSDTISVSAGPLSVTGQAVELTRRTAAGEQPIGNFGRLGAGPPVPVHC